ncbi:hypothetical protein FB451DRAFT_1561963 [Mycena latifolia]|nr:hypothetical protein FB451DRAFT_1561963 [Mycena latifolia]
MLALDDGRPWLIATLILCHSFFFLVQARPSLQKNLEHNTIGKLDGRSDSGLESASWIWTSDATTGNVAFIKRYLSPGGKHATEATITMVAVNQFTLWVNGNPIGASGDGADDWKSAQVLSTALNTTSNTFSVLAANNANAGAPAPGLLAAIKVSYSDGPSDIIYSDSSWAVSGAIPPDFPTPSDTSRFTAATLLAPFGSGSWGSAVTTASPDPDAITLSNGTWIWSTSDAAAGAAPGAVGFRKTFPTPSGRTARSATILLTVDDAFTRYVNGDYVGAPPAFFKRGQQFAVILSATSNTFTVIAQNHPGPKAQTAPSAAGVIATIRIQYLDGSSEIVRTDTSWLSGTFTSVSDFISAADSALGPTHDLGTMGTLPWGSLSGISNALAAAQVPSSPFANGSTPTSAGNAGQTSSSSAAAPPIALIVGPIIGFLALNVVGVALCWWLRRRRAQRRLLLGSQPFVAGNIRIHDERSEMAEVASQGATSHRYAELTEPHPFPPTIQFVSDAPQLQGIIPPTKLRTATAASDAANTSAALASEAQLGGHPARAAAGALDTTPDPPPRYRSIGHTRVGI